MKLFFFFFTVFDYYKRQSLTVHKCSFFHTNFQESVHVTQNFLVLIKNRVEWKTPSWAIFSVLVQRFYLNTIYRERKKEEERRKAVIFLKQPTKKEIWGSDDFLNRGLS